MDKETEMKLFSIIRSMASVGMNAKSEGHMKQQFARIEGFTTALITEREECK